MAFNGTRITIGTTPVPNSLIEKGSYTATTVRRVSKQWRDGTGTDHVDYFPDPKMEIAFNIRERSLEEQASICELFQHVSNLIVTYWDDATCTYKMGRFYMDNPTFSHLTAYPDNIQYAATTVTLHEY